MVVLDLLRLLLGASVLAFASYTDWKWRRAPNLLWRLLASVGALLLLVEAWYDPAPLPARWPYLLCLPVLLLLWTESTLGEIVAGVLGVGGAVAAFLVARGAPDAITAQWAYLMVIPLFVALIYALWSFGLIAGGADAQALMALGVLVPFPLKLAEGVPWLPSLLPGASVVFMDSLLVFMLIPISFLAWNLAHGDVRVPHALLGFKQRGDHVLRGHLWPMETVAEDGSRGTRLFASRMSEEEIDGAFARIQALGAERVWVTPKVPFMIPLLVGFVLAFSAGDLLSGALVHLIPRR